MEVTALQTVLTIRSGGGFPRTRSRESGVLSRGARDQIEATRLASLGDTPLQEWSRLPRRTGRCKLRERLTGVTALPGAHT